MEEQKINFLYPTASSSSITPQQNFSPTLDVNILPSFSQRQQVTISQIYPSRKIKHSFRKRSCSNSMPYYIPHFRHRQRTKSESQDNNSSLDSGHNLSMECDNFQMEMDYNNANNNNANTAQFNKIKLVQLKKSKSLESLNSKENKKEKEQNYSTMEFFDLNHQIQKLNLVHD